MNIYRFVVILCCLFMISTLPARAEMSIGMKKALVVGKAAAYGLGAGLIVGLASQVVKSSTKNIFLGGSLGMYAGIGLGLYLVLTTDQGTAVYEGPDTYDEFPGWQEGSRLLHQEEKITKLEDTPHIAYTVAF